MKQQPESGCVIELCLKEFDLLWAEGKRPQAGEFRHRFSTTESDDFVELIYHEFCIYESEGLNPSPDEFYRRYPEFRESLEKLFALHDGLLPVSLNSPLDPSVVNWFPEVGDSIGPFRIVGILGRGVSGIVFKALQHDLGDREVVLKISLRGKTSEAPKQARVNHPNVVPVFRQFQTEDGLLDVMVMPYLKSITLADLLTAARPGKIYGRIGFEPDLMTILGSQENFLKSGSVKGRTSTKSGQVLAWRSWVARMSRYLAEALQTGYESGVIHGDIKPANILIDQKAQPYLIDFHLAREWQPQRHRQVVLSEDRGGTLHYMPPERLERIEKKLVESEPASVDSQVCENARELHRADLYALGIVILELLTGCEPVTFLPSKPPSSNRELALALRNHRSTKEWFRAVRGFSKLPALWRELIARLLDPELSARPQHGRELAGLLKSIEQWESLKVIQRRDLKAGFLNRTLPAVAAIALLTGFATHQIHSQREVSNQIVAQLWSYPDTLRGDPASTEKRSDSERLRLAIDTYQEAISRNPELWKSTIWRSAFISPQDQLDADLWLADRVERITYLLENRSRGSVSDDDRKSALNLLGFGLNHLNVSQWQNRVRSFSPKRRAESKSRPKIQPSGRNVAAVSNLIDLIHLERKSTDQSAEKWERFWEKYPHSFAVQWMTATALASQNRHQQAARILERALEIRPEHFEAQRLAAFCHFKSQDYQSSFKRLNQALQIRPDDLAGLRLRAILRIYNGQRMELDREIQRLEELMTFRSHGKTDLDPVDEAQLLQQLDQKLNKPDQIFDLETINRINGLLPEDTQVMKLLACRHYLDQNFLEAAAILERLQERESLPTLDLVNLATLYRIQQQSAKAKKHVLTLLERSDFTTVFQLQKTVRDLCFAVLLDMESKDPQEALTYYNRLKDHCLNLGVDLGRCHYRMATCYIRLRSGSDLKNAERELIRAGQQNLSFIENWYINDDVFDKVRQELDPLLSEVFPGLNSLAGSLSEM